MTRRAMEPQDGQDADLSWVAQFMESVSQIGQAFRNVPSKVDEIKAVWGEQDKGTGLRVQSVVNLGFEAVVGILGSVLFFEIPIIVANQKAPLILLTLLLGGMFFYAALVLYQCATVCPLHQRDPWKI